MEAFGVLLINKVVASKAVIITYIK